MSERIYVCGTDPDYPGPRRKVYQLSLDDRLILKVFDSVQLLDRGEPEALGVVAVAAEHLQPHFREFKPKAAAGRFIVREYLSFAILLSSFGPGAAYKMALQFVEKLPPEVPWGFPEADVFMALLDMRDPMEIGVIPL